MPRPQFSIRTLLWLTLVVAAFLSGMRYGTWRERRILDSNDPFADHPHLDGSPATHE